MRVLAISGSLRAASINSAMLRAVARLAPGGVEVTIFEGMGALPLFNPDLVDRPTPAVLHLFDAVADADAVLFASPEYAHGVTGVVKNALDWLVGFEPFAGKAVAVVNTSARAHHADAALRETLATMAAHIVEAASITIPLLGAHLDEDGMVHSAPVSAAIGECLRALKSNGNAQSRAAFTHPVSLP